MSIPHVDGGDPIYGHKEHNCYGYSPCRWGVILPAIVDVRWRKRIPHVDGCDPLTQLTIIFATDR